MRLNAPKVVTFWIAVALAILGLVFYFIPFVSAFAFFILLVGFVVLMLGNFVKGM